MKNLYVKKPQKDKNKLYTRFSKYCMTHSKDLQELIKPYINKIEVNINFNQAYYNQLNTDCKSFYGDSVDSLLSGGSFNKVNSYRKYFHQSYITPSPELVEQINNSIQELLRFLRVYLYGYPRWKTTYYPDGKYRTHLDLIVNNCWHQDEVFDITINESNDMMLAKIVELLALTKDYFDYVNVFNLYNGCWYSVRTKNIPLELLNQLNTLFEEFVQKRINEEENN